MSDMQCEVCEHELDAQRKYVGREMMFGTRETFDYYQCPRCECLQIRPIPENLSRFYSGDYPAFAERKERGPASTSFRVRMQLERWTTRHRFGRPNIAGFLLNLLPRKRPALNPIFYPDLAVTPDSSILDVGCGNGDLLFDLASAGFRNLTGVDLFAQPQTSHASPRIVQGRLDEVGSTFDLIMLHHSFEHMPAPKQVFSDLAARLNAQGRLLLRIPLAGSYAWRHYGVDWVQLDAPRHLFLHTVKSICSLAESAGLELFKTIYDSNGFQFWGSELYRRDIPLTDPQAVWSNPPFGPFTRTEMIGFARRAEKLNEAQDGDQACFILRKS